MLNLIEVDNAQQLPLVRELFREYQAFLAVDLCFQGFEAELANLPGKYAPPNGAILLAEYQGKTAGCVALRAIDEKVCEMKRLYLRNEFRGLSIGEQLAQAIIHKAQQLGFHTMQLDTLQRLQAAMKLYQKLGFQRTDAYYKNPLSEVVYWQLDLRQ